MLFRSWLLIATHGIAPATSSVAVIDLVTLKVARAIPVPGVPQEVLVSPDGKSAYVSCFVKVPPTDAAASNKSGEKQIGQVAVIDLANWKVKSLIDAGSGADGLAWAAAP